MPVMCLVCKKLFSKQYNLNKHSKRVHNIQPKIPSYDQSKWNYKCLEEGCNRSFRHNKDLINHLSQDHHINMQIERMSFLNKEKFLAWKQLIEKKDKSNYIFLRSYKIRGKSVSYYTCNRSGKQTSSSNNKRRPKKQGSCKLNRNCTSSIKVIQDERLLVTWYRSHYGHSPDLEHIRLPKVDRSVVASKLILGVPPARILDSYRDKIGKNISREDLITRKDIQNIKKSYHIDISEGANHKNDAISVDLEIKQCEEKEHNPIEGKQSDHLKQIIIRHQTASSSKFSVEVCNESQTKWYINEEDHEACYVEKLLGQSCCNLICRECNICSHTYSCTCEDFCLTNSICKHIHYIEMKYFPKMKTEEILSSNELHQMKVSTEYVNTSDILRQSFSDKVIKTMSKIQNADKCKLTDEIMLQIENHLDTIDKLLELPSVSDPLEISYNEPGNEINTQQIFIGDVDACLS